MICMFQQCQVDYEDMQVFMCKCPLVLSPAGECLVQLILGTVVYNQMARIFVVIWAKHSM